jgi:hypothetical protein
LKRSEREKNLKERSFFLDEESDGSLERTLKRVPFSGLFSASLFFL